MVLLGLKRPEIFRQDQKYKDSVLKESAKKQCQVELISLMNREKLYLNSSLTLTEIAQILNIAPCYLSQIINETFQQNFRDFINKYRIEESKRLLTQENQNLNIMGIALDAGFNSKSAFNSAFKKHTGVTPKEFKNKASQANSL
jgi:AraC-like DNA-binding protein